MLTWLRGGQDGGEILGEKLAIWNHVTRGGAPNGKHRLEQARNEPFGSRPEPGFYLLAPILLLPPGEVPAGRAGVRLQSTGYCA
jgi:hypothetical protein